MGLKVGTVKIEAYNENWKLMFKEEKENLIKVFGDIALQIEHIGSTSIPGLSAKPIIDILVVLESFNEFEKVKTLAYSTGTKLIVKDNENNKYEEYCSRTGNPYTHYIVKINFTHKRHYNKHTYKKAV